VDYYNTKAIAYRRNGIRGPAYYDSMAVWAEPRVRRAGSDPALHVVWAIGLAGSLKRDAAVKEISLFRADKRYRWHAEHHAFTAEACVLAVLYDCAIEEIRLAMTEPWRLNPYILKLDPVWDPLRGRADFQKLVDQK